MGPKLLILSILLAFGLLLSGCTQSPQPTNAPGVAYSTPTYRYADLGTFTNNSTTSATTLGGVMDSHVISYTMAGNYTAAYAVITLQGSIDGTVWTYLTNTTVTGNSTGVNITLNQPMVYVRAIVTGWNSTVGNASAQSLAVKYVGKG